MKNRISPLLSLMLLPFLMFGQTWVGPSPGVWNDDPSNWSGGLPASDAIVNINDGNVVTLEQGATINVQQIQLRGDGELVIPCGSTLNLVEGGVFMESGKFTIEEGGTVNISQYFSALTIQENPATFSNAGTINVFDMSTIGIIEIFRLWQANSLFENLASGVININNTEGHAGVFQLRNGMSFENHGIINVGPNVALSERAFYGIFTSLISPQSILNGAGAQINLLGITSTFGAAFYAFPFAAITFNNEGSICYEESNFPQANANVSFNGDGSVSTSACVEFNPPQTICPSDEAEDLPAFSLLQLMAFALVIGALGIFLMERFTRVVS